MFALRNTEIPNSVLSFISVYHQRVNLDFLLDFLLRFFHHVQQISSQINIAVNGGRATAILNGEWGSGEPVRSATVKAGALPSINYP